MSAAVDHVDEVVSSVPVDLADAAIPDPENALVCVVEVAVVWVLAPLNLRVSVAV